MTNVETLLLGLIYQKEMSAYEIKKNIEYRNLKRWVKISDQSIFKKVIALTKKGYLHSVKVRVDALREKEVYFITDIGRESYIKGVNEISEKPLNVLLDSNIVFATFDLLEVEQQEIFLNKMLIRTQENLNELEGNLLKKDLPFHAKKIFQQQKLMLNEFAKWLTDYSIEINENQN